MWRKTSRPRRIHRHRTTPQGQPRKALERQQLEVRVAGRLPILQLHFAAAEALSKYCPRVHTQYRCWREIRWVRRLDLLCYGLAERNRVPIAVCFCALTQFRPWLPDEIGKREDR